jgi:hypothetical protein
MQTQAPRTRAAARIGIAASVLAAACAAPVALYVGAWGLLYRPAVGLAIIAAPPAALLARVPAAIVLARRGRHHTAAAAAWAPAVLLAGALLCLAALLAG